MSNEKISNLTENTAPLSNSYMYILTANGAGAYNSEKVSLSNVSKDTQSWSFALSNEDTALTTGLKLTWRTPYAITLTEIRGSLSNTCTGSNVVIDVYESANAILSNNVFIEPGLFTSKGANVQPALSVTSLVDDANVRFIIANVGSTYGGDGAKITLIGRRT